MLEKPVMKVSCDPFTYRMFMFIPDIVSINQGKYAVAAPMYSGFYDGTEGLRQWKKAWLFCDLSKIE